MIISNLPNYKKIVLVIILLAIIFHELIWHYLNKYLNLNNKKDEKKDEKKVKSKENFTNMNTYSHTFSLSNIFKNSTNNNEKYISILNTNQYNFLPDFFQKNLSKSNFLKSNVATNMTPDEYFKIENRNLKANNSEYKKK